MSTRDGVERDYEWTISVLPITPPMSGGRSFSAKVTRLVRRTSARVFALDGVALGECWGATEGEAAQMAETVVKAWIRRQ
jgi:hypothetical protein